jgi:hypothetical protein
MHALSASSLNVSTLQAWLMLRIPPIQGLQQRPSMSSIAIRNEQADTQNVHDYLNLH